MPFKDEVEKQLQGLDDRQICKFAWLCGVRALPFLSMYPEKRGFAYWTVEKRQKHLYSIFRALDAAYATDAKDEAVEAANAASAAYADAHADAAYAAYAAAYAVTDASVGATAAADAAYAAATRGGIGKQNFEKLLFSDIEAIKTSNLTDLNNDISIYSKIWQNFLDDLNDVGCGYWARHYEKLFERKFVIDEKELESRLGVPQEIKEQGTVAVERYLTDLKEQGVERLNEARIIILGEKGAGKTCLARRLKNPDDSMTSPSETTEGVDISVWEIPGEPERAVKCRWPRWLAGSVSSQMA